MNEDSIYISDLAECWQWDIKESVMKHEYLTVRGRPSDAAVHSENQGDFESYDFFDLDGNHLTTILSDEIGVVLYDDISIYFLSCENRDEAFQKIYAHFHGLLEEAIRRVKIFSGITNDVAHAFFDENKTVDISRI